MRTVVSRTIMSSRIPLICLCLILSACSQSFRTPDATDLVIRLMEVWESGHQNSLAEFVDSSAVYDDIPNNYRFEGIEGFESYIGHVHNWASEVSIVIHEVGGSADRAYAEWTMTGRQSRPIEGRIPIATDSTFTLKGLTVVEVADGKIIRAADYMDVLGFILQLGSFVELPGGVVIGKSK